MSIIKYQVIPIYEHIESTSFQKKNRLSNKCSSFLNDKILQGCDDDLLTQKAFDTINHDIFLRKLSVIGFSDDNVRWF